MPVLPYHGTNVQRLLVIRVTTKCSLSLIRLRQCLVQFVLETSNFLSLYRIIRKPYSHSMQKTLTLPGEKICIIYAALKMAAPLTIDNFEFDKLRAKSPETKKGGNITYYSIPFEYEDRKSLLKVESNFRVFEHENKEGIGYSLAIGIDGESEEFFTKLGERMAELAHE